MIDPKIQKRVLERFSARRRMREEELSRRSLEAEKKIPEIAEINKQLRITVLQVARAAFESGTDPKPRIDAVRSRHIDLVTERSELLVKNGYPADFLNLPPVCKRCSDYGYIGSDPCACFMEDCVKEQNKELSHMLNIDGQNFDSFCSDYFSENRADGEGGISPRENIEFLMNTFSGYARNFGRHSMNLLFEGAPGLGKTFMSSCIAKEVASKGFSVVYDTAVNVFSTMEREKFGDNTEELQMQIKRYLTSDLLIIDDLGTELTTSFVCSALYHLINTRLMEQRKTIISTNLQQKDIPIRYSPQIASRLSYEFDRFQFFGKDIRQVVQEMRNRG